MQDSKEEVLKAFQMLSSDGETITLEDLREAAEDLGENMTDQE